MEGEAFQIELLVQSLRLSSILFYFVQRVPCFGLGLAMFGRQVK